MPEETRRSPASALRWILAVLIVWADQITKALILGWLHRGESYPVPETGGLVYLTLVLNTGTAFGLFPGSNLFFIILSIIIITCLVFLLWRVHSHAERGSERPTDSHALRGNHIIPLVLILSGAVGNLIDRFRWGYVVDFIDLRVWPVFNFADSCITIGILWLLWSSFRRHASHPL